MKNSAHKILNGLVPFFFIGVVDAQDINFSQFYELPLLRNPSLAGFFNGNIRATSAFRSQWSSVTIPYQTMGLGIELKTKRRDSNDYFSFGAQITHDVAGDSKFGKTQFLPIFAYHKSLSTDKDAYLTAGFMAGFVQQRFDPSGLKFDDQFVNGTYSSTNPSQQTFSRTNLSYLDAAVGLNYSTTLGEQSKMYIGAAYFHFNRPKVAFSFAKEVTLNKKFVINAGLSIPSGGSNELILYADYFKQGGNNQGQGGFLFKHELVGDEDMFIGIFGGSFYRWNDAIIPVVKVDYNSWMLGVTYDVNINKLKSASQMRGGFELTLSYRFTNMMNISLEKMRCPVSF